MPLPKNGDHTEREIYHERINQTSLSVLTYFDNVGQRMTLPEEEGEDGDRGQPDRLDVPSPPSSHLVKAASYGVFAAVRG